MMYGRLSVASGAALTIFVGIFLGCAADEQDGQLLVIDASIVMDANGQLDTGLTDSELSDTMSSRDARILADLAMPMPVDAAIRRCQTRGPAWTPGMPAFRQVTDAWGLAGVEGEYLSVTDVDGDHWPDLIVRKGGGAEDFSQNGIRHKWLLRNNGQGRFEDPTKRSRLFASRLNPAPGFGRPGKVIVSGDVDNDGDLDVFIGQSRTDRSNLEAETSDILLNNGDGTYTLGPADSAARFVDFGSNPAGASFVDFDRDGNLDLWVVHNELPGYVFIQDTLLRGDGAGGFEDVTEAVGLTTAPWNLLFDINNARAHSWGWGSTACDLDDDGLPELMASAYGRSPNHLWTGIRSQDGVSFENASLSSGYAFDENQDWRDNLSAQCYCADEPEAPACDTCPAPADPRVCDGLRNAFGPNYRWGHDNGRMPYSLGGVTGTTLCTDVDNDGYLDLVNYEIVHSDTGRNSDPTQVLFNRGETPLSFERPGPEATGLTRTHTRTFWDDGDMTGAVFDFDNDGLQDLYISSAEYAGTRAHLYHQDQPRQFVALAVGDFFEHFRAHGIAVADFDRDGDLDVLVGHSRFRCEGFEGTECMPTNQVQLYENLVGQDQHWLQLKLIGGEGTNGAAVGARVTVLANGVRQTQVVDGGHGRFGLQRDLTLHFGLGDACEALVIIAWPDGRRSETRFVTPLDRRLLVRQGQDPTELN